jgi:hypothetical protein
MRDRETIDSELRRLAEKHRSLREQGRQPSGKEFDDLLDERLGHRPARLDVDVLDAFERQFASGTTLKSRTTTLVTARRRKGVLFRFGLRAALPLSLLAVVAAVLVTFVVRPANSAEPNFAEQQAESSSSKAPSDSVARGAPVAAVPAADLTFVTALKQEGVPVPSQEYVTTKGRAVCDFLKRESSFADAVAYVQRISIWNATQSADVTAGAIVAYCPQSRPVVGNDLQPTYQNALSDMQAIEQKLQSIQGDLRGIEGALSGLPGHP